MFDSELVVTCHCPVPIHPQIYYVENGKLGTPLGAGVNYVDPKCPENTWDKILDNSKTYVWGMYCPVYPLLLYANYEVGLYVSVIVEILDNSYRVLKNGGSVVFPDEGIINSDRTDKLSEILQFINRHTRFNNWKLSLINANEFPFNLGYINKSNFLRIPNILYVFTKIEVEPPDLISGEEAKEERGGRRKRARKNLTKKLRFKRKKYLSKKRRTRRQK